MRELESGTTLDGGSADVLGRARAVSLARARRGGGELSSGLVPGTSEHVS